MLSKKFLNIVGFIAVRLGVAFLFYLMDLLFDEFTVFIMILSIIGVVAFLDEIIKKKEQY